MAQRPGRGDDRSDLDDVKALASKARSETGGPVLRRPDPAELSGVRPRRDSVVGMRLTPPPRAAGGGDLPNWLWGVLGCLSVLLLGFAGLFFLGRSGKLGPLLGEAASLVGGTAPAAAPAPAPAPAAQDPAPAAAPAPAAQPGSAAVAEREARPEHAHAHEAAPGEPPVRAEPAPGATAEAVPVPPADNAPAVAADEAGGKRAHGTKAKGSKETEAPAGAGSDDGAGKAPEAVKAAAAQPARAAAAAPKAADDSDDDDTPPGQDDVERALDALAPKIRGCFVKYQIKGTARVRLVATPAGKAESVNVTGDFEDTPTGNCVESILSEAKLPSFKGAPLKLSQSYQLR
jgi:hypothetical protein